MRHALSIRSHVVTRYGFASNWQGQANSSCIPMTSDSKYSLDDVRVGC